MDRTNEELVVELYHRNVFSVEERDNLLDRVEEMERAKRKAQKEQARRVFGEMMEILGWGYKLEDFFDSLSEEKKERFIARFGQGQW